MSIAEYEYNNSNIFIYLYFLQIKEKIMVEVKNMIYYEYIIKLIY
jgi:hypothetical protein